MRRTELKGSREGWVSGLGVRRLGLLGLALLVAACSGDGGPTTVDRDVLVPGGVLLNHDSDGDPGQCFGDDAVQYSNLVSGLSSNSSPDDVNCTANDIDIAIAIVGGVEGIPNYNPGDPVQCDPSPGNTITLDMTAVLVQNANSAREDIGVWIGTGQPTAISGQCNHYFLDTDLNNVFNADGDHCAGMASGASANLPLGEVTIPCTAVTTDPEGDQPFGTYLQVGACIGWKVPGADTECPDNAANDGIAVTPDDFRAGTLLANKSKCNCEPFFIPLIVPGQITIIKDAVPNDPADFAFTTTGGGNLPANFSLDDDGDPTLPASRTFTNLTPGNFSVTESALAGWDLTNLVCNATGTGTSASVNLGTRTANFTIASGGAVTCTYTNTRRGTITIIKDAVPNDAQNFAFTSTGAAPLGGGFTLDDDLDPTLSNTQVFNNVLPGSYSVTEGADPAGWQFTSLTCSSSGAGTSTSTASKTANITLGAGGSVTCTYVNSKQGTITIIKDAVPNDAQNFAFTSTGAAPLGGGFTLDDDLDPTLSNTQVFNNVPLGSFSVTEGANPAGWEFTSLSCTPTGTGTTASTATKTANITIAAGGSVTCTYTNTKQAKVQVIKTVNTAAITGSETFTFTLRTGATNLLSGSVLETIVANSGNGGTLNFTTFLTPGNSYQICEVVMPGWSSSISGLAGAFTIQTEPDGDNSTICVPFTPTAGQTVVFNIDNTPPPGGDARTIGFWKNWSSCGKSNGNQDPVLDQTLALAVGGILIGDLTVDTCLEAVAILNKSDISTGKKMASDPAFNLAAQLLAARLNILAGAGSCPALVTAMNSAQTLLAAVDFDGVGVTTMTDVQKAQANALAATLDSYNNNNLCP